MAILFYAICAFSIVYDIVNLEIHLISLILLSFYCKFKLISFSFMIFFLSLILLLSKFSKKAYMQLGDYILLLISGSSIVFANISLFFFLIAISHLLISVLYKKLTNNHNIPMVPAILISWMLLY